MPIKRAAPYIRVSSGEQARHGLSLGEQRADLMEYAAAHKYAVAGVYAARAYPRGSPTAPGRICKGFSGTWKPERLTLS